MRDYKFLFAIQTKNSWKLATLRGMSMSDALEGYPEELTTFILLDTDHGDPCPRAYRAQKQIVYEEVKL
jgi:hypothetical protein